jgi:hypothetical protein
MPSVRATPTVLLKIIAKFYILAIMYNGKVPKKREHSNSLAKFLLIYI